MGINRGLSPESSQKGGGPRGVHSSSRPAERGKHTIQPRGDQQKTTGERQQARGNRRETTEDFQRHSSLRQHFIAFHSRDNAVTPFSGAALSINAIHRHPTPSIAIHPRDNAVTPFSGAALSINAIHRHPTPSIAIHPRDNAVTPFSGAALSVNATSSPFIPETTL